MKIVLSSDGSVELLRGERVRRGQDLSRRIYVEWNENESPIDTGQILADNMAVQLCITRPDGEQSGWYSMIKIDAEDKYYYTLQAWDTEVEGIATVVVRWHDITIAEENRPEYPSDEASFIVDNGKIAQPLNISSENYNEIVLQFITPLSAQAFRKYNVNALPDTITYSADGAKTAPALYFNFTHDVVDAEVKTINNVDSVIDKQTCCTGFLLVSKNEDVQTEIFFTDIGKVYFRTLIKNTDVVAEFRNILESFQTKILANPPDKATKELKKLKVGDTTYNVFGLSELEEYDKQKQSHLLTELNKLNKHIVCTFNITTVINKTITLQNLTNMLEINWGDGTIDNNLSHTYAKIGEYTCVIKGVTSIGENAFYNCSKLTSIVIPNSVESIGENAFYNCTSLTSVVIGDNVKDIGSHAFYNCTSLTSVVIGDSVTSIGNSAFSGCSSLTSVVIPNSVTSIGEWAFFYCTSLTSVVIGDSVESIGEWAFNYCTSLTSVVVKTKTPPSMYTETIPSTVEKIIVPIETINLYKEATDWSSYRNKIVAVVDTNYLENQGSSGGDDNTIVIEDYEFPDNLSVSTFVTIHNLLEENKYKSILIKGKGINIDTHGHEVTLGQVCSWNASGTSVDPDAFSITALVNGKMYKYTIHDFISPETYGTVSVEEVDLSQGNYELIEKIIIGYSVLETKPDDWETNYSSYYTWSGEGLDLHYVPISSPDLPEGDFPVGYAYSFDPDIVVKSLSRKTDLYGNPYKFKKILFYSNAPQATAQSTGYVIFETDYEENGTPYGSQVNVQRFVQTNNKTNTVAVAKIENGRIFVEGCYGSENILTSITGNQLSVGSTGYLGLNWMKREPKANYITKVEISPTNSGLPANTEVYIYGVK